MSDTDRRRRLETLLAGLLDAKAEFMDQRFRKRLEDAYEHIHTMDLYHLERLEKDVAGYTGDPKRGRITCPFMERLRELLNARYLGNNAKGFIRSMVRQKKTVGTMTKAQRSWAFDLINKFGKRGKDNPVI